MVLRMEDLDPDRCGPEHALRLADDLTWLGLDWDEGWQPTPEGMSYAQSTRAALYEAAFSRLEGMGLVYPCYCTRAQRLAAGAPHLQDGPPAPCPCRSLTNAERDRLEAEGKLPAFRISAPGEAVCFTDGHYGPRREQLSDFIVRRADGVFAYQLAVTVDDGLMGVTRVVRGRDLLSSAGMQLWLHGLLGFNPPAYCHVPLLLAPDGRRLSKREQDLDMKQLRRRYTPAQLTGCLAHLAGLLPEPAPVSARELVSVFSWEKVPRADLALSETFF